MAACHCSAAISTCATGEDPFTTYEELKTAIINGAETIGLGADITITDTLVFYYSVTINGNEYTLTRGNELMEPIIKQAAGANTLIKDVLKPILYLLYGINKGDMEK